MGNVRDLKKEGIVGSLYAGLHGTSCLFCGWVGMNEPAIVEQLVREDFDAIVLDMQHGAVDVGGAIRGISAAALFGTPAIVRIPIGEFSVAARVMDAGAAAVIAPMINSVQDARRFVEHVKFPPIGQRSWGPRAALAFCNYGEAEYLQNANRITLAIAMIETEEAIGALDDILAIPGIDGVFVGPSDLSIAIHNGAAVNPLDSRVEEALDTVLSSGRRHQKFTGVYCGDGKRAQALAMRGFNLCAISNDANMMRSAARMELVAARS